MKSERTSYITRMRICTNLNGDKNDARVKHIYSLTDPLILAFEQSQVKIILFSDQLYLVIFETAWLKNMSCTRCHHPFINDTQLVISNPLLFDTFHLIKI